MTKIRGIEWEVDYNNRLDHDPEERTSTYVAYGSDSKGNGYEGTAVICCGELIDVEAVEQI